MPNRTTDILFQLMQSLEKAEKRNFKLYIQRNSAIHDLKIIELFDALDKIKEYDEAVLLKKLKTIQKPQLANTKAHLYKQLLASLRIIKSTESIDMHLHEQLDYARILYNKGLYLQSLKILEKLKEQAVNYYQDSFLIQAISLEKKIETLHITRSLENRAEKLAAEANEVNEKRRVITRLSNLALRLYSWYIKNGHARNEKDEAGVTEYFKAHLPPESEQGTGFYERLYLYQSYAWLAFIRQNFLMYYRYTQKWVTLFTDNPFMIEVEAGHFIKGMHNLLNAHFDLRNYRKFNYTLIQFEKFCDSPIAHQHDTNRIQAFVYLNSAILNQYIIQGTFAEGLLKVAHIEHKLEEYALYLDRHRVLVFNYKIATLHFGAGNYSHCIDYLRRIINGPLDLRNDLQCYARLLHLIAHYEMGNVDIMEHLVKSVYRFMAKMENLTIIEEEMFKFLQRPFYLSPEKLLPEFKSLLDKVKQFENSRFETRSFAYLDIVSWLEGKVYNKPMSIILEEKYLKSKRR